MSNQLVIPFSDVIAIEKRMTALIIPNAIQVITTQSRVSSPSSCPASFGICFVVNPHPCFFLAHQSRWIIAYFRLFPLPRRHV
jgi:flavin reductase (DIM6/NTAB) family NADH-FMN oxidoreductase RutF